MTDDYPALFEAGVADYFRDFGRRRARETQHQAWLLISVARYVSAQCVVSELQVSNQDLRPFGELKKTRGAVNYDFAISRSEMDLRTWKSLTVGWQQGTPTSPRTLQTLREVAVLAEMKISSSTATTRNALVHDLRKLACAMRFLKHHDCQKFPACYFVLLDPERTLPVDLVIEQAQAEWPDFAPFPKILVGPE